MLPLSQASQMSMAGSRLGVGRETHPEELFSDLSQVLIYLKLVSLNV